MATRRNSPKLTGTRRRTPWGLLLLALFVFGQGYSLAHHSVVEHHTCPVDGALAHGDHGHGLSDQAGLLVEAGDSESSQSIVTPGGDAEEHGDHCAIGDPREQRRFSLPAIAVRVQPPPCTAWSTPPLTGSAESRIPVFGLAPKQSPPRAA